MRARRGLGIAAGLAAAALLGVAVLAGCAKKQAFQPGNAAPETYVFVQDTTGSVAGHPVNHLVHLYWFGTDPDGDVLFFKVRFVYPGQDSTTVPWDTTYATDSVVAVQTPDGVSMPVFWVQAVDNDSLADDSPAKQRFTFTNQPPTLHLSLPPRTTDTTFASLTLRWTAADPDGDSGRMRVRIWLDGNLANTLIVPRSPFTLPTDLFKQGGNLLSGYRTVYVQPIDDGGMLGALDSATWYVRAPLGGNRGRLLLIDDLPSATGLPNRFLFDSIFVNSATTVLPGGFDILRTQFTQPFRSSADLEQTLKLFDAVVWYRGPQVGISTQLRDYQPGVEAYLADSGRLFLEGLNLVQGLNADGALSPGFITDHLGSLKLHLAPIVGRVDSTAELSVNSFAVLHSPALQDSLRTVAIYKGLRGFVVNDTSDVLLWARAGALSPPNAEDIPVAVMVPQTGGGKCAMVTLPLRGADGFVSAGGLLRNALRRFLAP